MHYCGQCGEKVPEAADFCGYCGSPVGKDNTPVLDTSEIEIKEVNVFDNLPNNSEIQPVPRKNFGYADLKFITLWGASWGFGYIWDTPITVLFVLIFDAIKLNNLSFYPLLILIAMYFIMGLLVGKLQLTILRKLFQMDSRWVWYTAIGSMISDGLIRNFVHSTELYVIGTGFVLGGAQWMLLKKFIPRAYLWMPIVALSGWLTIKLSSNFGSGFGNFVFQFVYGVLGGIGLLILIKSRGKAA